jgi:hypothetical protein
MVMKQMSLNFNKPMAVNYTNKGIIVKVIFLSFFFEE